MLGLFVCLFVFLSSEGTRKAKLKNFEILKFEDTQIVTPLIYDIFFSGLLSYELLPHLEWECCGRQVECASQGSVALFCQEN